jgi:signal transduction histidine kinase
MAEIERVRGRLPKESQMDGFSRIVPRWVHQINNPLASIMGSAELGLGEIGDSRAVARRMACILSATETIRQMCRDIMQLGQRYEEGFSRVEVTELLDSSLEVFADLMTGKGASLIREYPDERLVVNCRPKGLGEVLQNLILNALEAMEASPAKVLRVAVERAGAGGPCAIVIEDSGPGIPAERTSRVFSPYFTTKPGGNGLGLAVARDLMERMGGRIELQSEVGRGTLLRLWLPAVLEPGESSGEERPLASAC